MLFVPPVPPWYVYVLRCSDGTLYTGIAKDVAARMAAHDAGRGARYTRGRGPLALCAARRCPTKGDALRLEWAIKQLPRADKEALASARRFRLFARRVLAPKLVVVAEGRRPAARSATRRSRTPS